MRTIKKVAVVGDAEVEIGHGDVMEFINTQRSPENLNITLSSTLPVFLDSVTKAELSFFSQKRRGVMASFFRDMADKLDSVPPPADDD